MPPAIIADSRRDAAGTGDQVFQGFFFMFRTGYGLVEIVYIGLVMFAVMDLHGLRVNIRLECIM
jgi:hypothetical protein